MAGRNKPLVLVVDAKIDSFKQGAAAIEQTLEELLASGGEFADVFKRKFADIGNATEVAMQQATKRITADIGRMRREAEQAAKFGADFNPAGGFTSQSQGQLADNFTASAARARQLSDAYRQVAKENKDMAVAANGAANELLVQSAVFERDAEAAARNADMLAKVEAAMGGVGGASDEAARLSAGSAGAMREGYRQVGFQVSDFMVQVSGGTSAIRAASMQAPQLIQAMALMGSRADGAGGRFAKFAGILNGPWGAAILIGTSILGLLATELLDTEDAAEQAEDQTYDFGRSLDFLVLKADAAQNAIKQLVGETERLLKIQGNFDRQIAENAERAVQQGQERVAAAKQRVADIENAPGLSNRIEQLFTIGKARDELAAAEKFLADAKLAAQNARLGLSQRAVIESRDPYQGRLNRIAEDVGDLETRRRASIDVERLDPRVRAYELRKRDAIYISDAEYQAELNRLEGLREKVEKDRQASQGSRAAGGGNADSVGDMTALLQQLFPGVKITSTTGGKHVKGSDHYVGRAVDFVVPGSMDAASFSKVKAALEEAGVTIRRGSSGKQQFFGPGNGAKTAGDHDDHYHLAWEGKASPEAAQRLTERRADEAQRNREAVDGALLASKEQQARLARLGVSDATRLAELDIAAIDAALERKLAQNAKLELDHAEVDAIDRVNAETERRAVREKLRADIADKALEEERRQIGVAATLLELEGQLARTTKQKHDVALRLINLRYRDEKVSAAQQFARDGNFEGYLDNVGVAQTRRNVDRTKLGEQYRGPTADYRARLEELTGDMDEAFDGIAARGLQSLEDGLVGVITGTENVATAFKRMAASILADIARIAVQKVILSAFGIGFAGGDVPKAATGLVPKFASGLISGPGTGTSDSILAWHEGMGLIRVSNGESIITAEGTRKHRGLLQAINDNSLPSFATGMVASYPTIPSPAALRAPQAGASQYFDLRGAVVTEELYRTMNQIGAAHAARALAAAPAMAMDEMAMVNAQRIPA